MIAEIKKLAAKGQHNAAKIMAKDVSRLRTQQNQYLMMSSQLKSIAMQVDSLRSQQMIMGALKGSTGVLQNLNAEMDVAEIRTVLKEFSKQSMIAEGKQESMGDAFDMLDGAGVAEDADEVYNGILGEIGMSVGGVQVNTTKIAQPAAAEEVKDEEDMMARLAALKM